MNFAKQLRALLQQKAEKKALAQAIINAALDAGREMTATEQTDFDAHMAAIDKMNATQASLEKLISLETDNAMEISANARIEGGAPAVLSDPRRGFANFGDFARDVRSAGRSGGGASERLIVAAAPSTFGNETSGADGGFAIPPQFASDIWTLALDEESFVPYTDSYNISGNNMAFPKDETTPWGTNGIRAYWQGEATAGTPTKPSLGVTSQRLKKLMALVPVSDELLNDAPALEQYLGRKMGSSLSWKLNESILNGTGDGQPQGVLVSGAALQVAKDSGQSANTVTTTNITNMVARLPPGSFKRAVWLVNNDVLGSLFSLTLGNYPIYLPVGANAGGIQGNPYGMLMGRPILITQHAASFSAAGDIQLHDFSYYRMIHSAAGPQMATSMHLYFDADAMAFRLIYRVDGQSMLSAQISPANGSNKMSPFLKLQAR